jgi:hypothetical protein
MILSNGGREGTELANAHTNQNRPRIPPRPFRPRVRTPIRPSRLGSPLASASVHHVRATASTTTATERSEMRALRASAMCRRTHTRMPHVRSPRVRRRRPGALAKPWWPTGCRSHAPDRWDKGEQGSRATFLAFPVEERSSHVISGLESGPVPSAAQSSAH